MLDPVAGSLERYMDLLAARQKLVASNIANANVEVVAGDDLRGGTRTNTFAPNSMTTSISAP